MAYSLSHILHLFFLMLFVGVVIATLLDDNPLNRKRNLKYSGIAGLLVFLSGFALAGFLKIGFPHWLIVKIICWFVLAAIPALVYRRTQSRPITWALTLVVLFTAITMASVKPH